MPKVTLALFLTLLVLGKHEANAQQARSFEQLQMLVKQDDTITVTEAAGPVTRGTIVQITDSSLQLIASGVLRDLVERDILQISQRRSDSLSNGARYGAVVGVSLGILGAIALGFGDNCTGCAVAVVPLYTVLGIGTGVAIDAMITRDTTIFTVNRDSSNRVKPVLSANRRGLSVRVDF